MVLIVFTKSFLNLSVTLAPSQYIINNSVRKQKIIT